MEKIRDQFIGMILYHFKQIQTINGQLSNKDFIFLFIQCMWKMLFFIIIITFNIFQSNECHSNLIILMSSTRMNSQSKEDSSDRDACVKDTKQSNYLEPTLREYPFSVIESHESFRSGKILQVSPFLIHFCISHSNQCNVFHKICVRKILWRRQDFQICLENGIKFTCEVYL